MTKAELKRRLETYGRKLEVTIGDTLTGHKTRASVIRMTKDGLVAVIELPEPRMGWIGYGTRLDFFYLDKQNAELLGHKTEGKNKHDWYCHFTRYTISF